MNSSVDPVPRPKSQWLNAEACEFLFGHGHGDWIAGLDARVARLAERFTLEPQEPLAGGLMGAVVRCESRAWGPVVLKVGPEPVEQAREQRFYELAPAGVLPRLFAHDDGALVLEWVPGRVEQGRLGDAACEQVAALGLWSSSPPMADGLIESLDHDAWQGRIVARLASRDATVAERVAEAFTALASELRAGPEVLCHGDMHSENFLEHDGALRVIDPYPLVAPVGFDVGFWATDPWRGPGALPRAERVARVAGMRETEVLAWTLACTSRHLSHHWAYGTYPELAAVAHAEVEHLLSLAAP